MVGLRLAYPVGADNGGRSDVGMVPWGQAMKPFTIFGHRFSTCHVLPALTMVLLLAATLLPVFVIASHFLPPVQLTSIWLEPRVFSVADVAAGRAEFTLRKSGKWKRLCDVDAQQTFIDHEGSIRFRGETHAVEVPPSFDAMRSKPRTKPDVVPKILNASPGLWRLRLVNINGACWPWERLWPIVPSEPVEATFEIR